ASLDVGNKSDAAGILVARRIIESHRRRHAWIGRVRKAQARVDEWRRFACSGLLALPLPHPWSPSRRITGRRTFLLRSAACAPRPWRTVFKVQPSRGPLAAGTTRNCSCWSPFEPQARCFAASFPTALKARMGDWDSNTVL